MTLQLRHNQQQSQQKMLESHLHGEYQQAWGAGLLNKLERNAEILEFMNWNALPFLEKYTMPVKLCEYCVCGRLIPILET